MPIFDLTGLTVKQRHAWRMRYQYGWRMKKMAISLGISEGAVSKLIRRAQVSAGISIIDHFTVKRTRGRRVRAIPLSQCFNY